MHQPPLRLVLVVQVILLQKIVADLLRTVFIALNVARINELAALLNHVLSHLLEASFVSVNDFQNVVLNHKLLICVLQIVFWLYYTLLLLN